MEIMGEWVEITRDDTDLMGDPKLREAMWGAWGQAERAARGGALVLEGAFGVAFRR